MYKIGGDTVAVAKDEELTTVGGYECPKVASKAAKKVLRQLRRHGTVIFTHDDGPSLSVRGELNSICGAIGITVFQSPYELVLIDEDQMKRIEGSKFSEEECRVL